ncbi:hypothetical protein [Streptomyces sp. DSM 15324]|uniref:hypothetical protein n=1 Tax=Streptomyces sp. DSM 15324 TaxID=1739111 RepID=UPI00082A6941|nr:hypothetical protein [Streptomyces sp. DSM 15324]
MAHERGDGVQQTRPQADPRPGQADAERRDQARREGRRADGRQAQEGLAGAHGEDGMQEQVVQAVHGVHPVQQPPDLRHRAPRHLEGDGLVTPHAPAVQPPQTEREPGPDGQEHRRTGPVPDVHGPHFVGFSTASWLLTEYLN